MTKEELERDIHLHISDYQDMNGDISDAVENILGSVEQYERQIVIKELEELKDSRFVFKVLDEEHYAVEVVNITHRLKQLKQ